ncbi:MAG: threonylcarbamoyl-AMP synthase [Gemmatimonadaceae bacterium]|nr:threonylcarbamoyl-AMP synthase [Chitinophagaceae bacterium]
MKDFLPDIESCLSVLNAGGVILYPTDTVWGLGCDATNPEAVAKIFTIKQRAESKSLIVLMSGERDILQHVAAPDLAVFDYLQTLTRPTTVIYENAIGLAENILATDGSVGIRIVNETFCRNLIKRFRKPIVSTSANVSGQPAPQHFSEVTDQIKNSVDYCVQYRQDDKSAATASSVIKWNGAKPPTIIRP